MIQQSYPSLNDIEPSWADIALTFSIGGGQFLDMEAIKALKWNRKVEVGERRGASGGRVMARTTGQGSQEASATLYRSGLRQLIRALMDQAPVRGNQAVISLVSFDITVQHTPPGEFDIYQTIIKGCRYLGDADDMKEGNEADTVECTLNPIEIAQFIDGREVVLL
jgi:hypothetical protein